MFYGHGSNFFDFLVTDGGLGFGQCVEIFGEKRAQKMWCLFSNECLQSEVYFWSKISLVNRRRWFDYIYKIQSKYEGFDERFKLDESFEWFEKRMKNLVDIDVKIRESPQDFFAKTFRAQNTFMTENNKAVHFYQKWILYGKNTLTLIRNMDSATRFRFISQINRFPW